MIELTFLQLHCLVVGRNLTKIKKQRSSRHVDCDSMWRDNRQFANWPKAKIFGDGGEGGIMLPKNWLLAVS